MVTALVAGGTAGGDTAGSDMKSGGTVSEAGGRIRTRQDGTEVFIPAAPPGGRHPGHCLGVVDPGAQSPARAMVSGPAKLVGENLGLSGVEASLDELTRRRG